jgi:hypothetical protein
VEPSNKSSFQPYLSTGLFMALLGWGGLVTLVLLALPTLGPRWLFFFLLLFAVTGTSLPLSYFFNRRFSSSLFLRSTVILRQAIWVGVYADFLAWLQLGRVLTSTLVLFLAAGLVVVEFLIQLRERSQWKPEEPKHE